MNKIRTVMDFPMPPSSNSIWRARHQGTGNVYRSADYKSWLAECMGICLQKRWHKAKVTGPYEITITFNREKCRHGSDLGNREKAVSDMLQAAGILENDNLAERIELRWGTHADSPVGCRVILDALILTTEATSLLPMIEGETV